VAEALNIGTVLIHPLAGVLSAYGIGVAELRVLRHASIEAPLDAATVAAMIHRFDELSADACEALVAQGVEEADIALERRLLIKVAGADTSLRVAWSDTSGAEALAAAFHSAHAQHFGFRAGSEAVLAVESLEIEAHAALEQPAERAGPRQAHEHAAVAAATRRIWFDGWQEVAVCARDGLAPGGVIAGPALITEAHATTVIERNWRAAVDAEGCLVLTRSRPVGEEAVPERRDPIMLEVFNNAFMHIAEEMGTVLESTAHSVNIKERLDFSCAVFDASGGLIANAPHMPVHLGSMGDSVQTILRDCRAALAANTSFMLNTPYNGGTHLPDITVVTPVFGPTDELTFFVASRAHHADIGGLTPGSMPPASRTIDEEGVLFDGVQIVEQGRFREAEVRGLLERARYPARNPEQNVADLKAQLAANARGVAGLTRMTARFGLSVVRAYMRHVQDNAEACVRAAIATLSDGRWTLELDGGERIVVDVLVDRAHASATIDFAGTSAASPTNFNAPSSIVRAAVLYVFRTLVRENIPLNAGCLRPLTIRLPEDCLLNPRYPSAVVAGNVETSQCIVDALLAALDVCAASQGTMNNFTFGNERYQYYETVCGGAGASRASAGASAVHTHMTNSRLTDAEVLEARYPVRVRRFEIRRGSGGDGARRGGDGVVREVEFLEPMHAAILANRRRTAPFGLRGGRAAACGRNYAIRADGTRVPLAATGEVDLAAGDRFVIETPGGGGYGAPDDADRNSGPSAEIAGARPGRSR
jgi:5-oxoprolinase (ATP-hydrolysing)